MDESFKPQTEKNIELSEKNKILKNKFQEFFLSLPKNKIPTVWDEITEHGQKIRRDYKDPERYEIFHVLIGSTLNKDAKTDFYLQDDFLGEDSVEEFINNLIDKYSV
jgi:hypothetical protein